MFVSLQNVYVEVLTPRCSCIWRGGFGRLFDLEAALSVWPLHRINDLVVKGRVPENSLPPFSVFSLFLSLCLSVSLSLSAVLRTWGEGAICKPRGEPKNQRGWYLGLELPSLQEHEQYIRVKSFTLQYFVPGDPADGQRIGGICYQASRRDSGFDLLIFLRSFTWNAVSEITIPEIWRMGDVVQK